MRTLLSSISVLACGLAFVACSSGGSGGSGGGGSSNPTTAPSPPPVVCTPPVSAAPVTNPTSTVGSGTAASVTEAALQTALDAGGTVVFDTGGQALVLTLTGTLQINADVVLDGGGLVTLSGGNAVRIMDKAQGVDLTLQNITLANGRAPDNGAAIRSLVGPGTVTLIDTVLRDNACTSSGPDVGGAALYTRLQTLVIASGCTFQNNQASNGGAVGTIGSTMEFHNCAFLNNSAIGAGTGQGGIGGAIYIDGVHQNGTNRHFELCGCSFRNNTANDIGGAVFTYFYPGTNSTSSINATTFDQNTVTAGTGLGGALYHQDGTLTLTASTFSANTATRHGGGLWLLTPTTASVTNCTFSANQVTSASEGLGGALSLNEGTITLTNTTIAFNHAGFFAGGIFASTNAAVTVRNVLLHQNTGVEPFNGLNCNREMIDGGGNMQWPQLRPNGTTDTLCAAGSTFADSGLLALANNGGPTETHALPMGSPAVDAGTASGAPSIDQRGNARDASPDVGAYEQ